MSKKPTQKQTAKADRNKKVKSKYAGMPDLAEGMAYGTSEEQYKTNVFHLENSGLTTIQAAEEADAIREAS